MYLRGHKVLIEVEATDIKLLASGLDKLLQLEAKQLRKGRTVSEGRALESLLGQLVAKPEPVAMAIWCVEDVMGRAKERHVKISREQA